MNNIQQTLTILLLIWGLPLQAAKVEVAMSQSPYYANIPVILEIHASDFEESPQPTIDVSQPNNGKLTLVDTNANVSSNIQIINGHMSQSKIVEFVYRYHFVANKAGNYRLGPFKVSQGSIKKSTGQIPITLTTIPTTGEQQIHLILPDTVYIGQQVPIKLEWWVDNRLKGKVYKQRAFVPFFDQIEAFQFIDDKSQTTSQASININTPAGLAEFPATAEIKTDNGQQYIVHTAQRTMTPLQVGKYQIEPATVMVEKVISWRRSIFGTRSVGNSKTLQAIDKARTLTVKPIPLAQRPASFSGAVGDAFSITVATNRSVVQAGDPILLTITIGGGLAVKNVTLPTLANSGLSAQQFHLPNADITGIYENGKKTFKVTVRVLNETINAIPPIAFSWFNPITEQFETTHSQPISLSVNKAQIISANDVIASTAVTPQNNKPKPIQQQPTTQPSFELTGADLAIEKDPNKLLVPQHIASNQIILWVCYLSALIIMMIAVISRRRANIDPKLIEYKKQMLQLHQQLKQVNNIDMLAKTLRAWVAIANSPLPNNEIDALLATCDNLTYAPQTATGQLDAELKQRALTLFETYLEQTA